MCAHVDLQASAIWILTQTDAPACSLVISLVLPSCWGDGGGLDIFIVRTTGSFIVHIYCKHNRVLLRQDFLYASAHVLDASKKLLVHFAFAQHRERRGEEMCYSSNRACSFCLLWLTMNLPYVHKTINYMEALKAWIQKC